MLPSRPAGDDNDLLPPQPPSPSAMKRVATSGAAPAAASEMLNRHRLVGKALRRGRHRRHRDEQETLRRDGAKKRAARSCSLDPASRYWRNRGELAAIGAQCQLRAASPRAVAAARHAAAVAIETMLEPDHLAPCGRRLTRAGPRPRPWAASP